MDRAKIAEDYCEADIIILENLADRVKHENLDTDVKDEIILGLLEVNKKLREIHSLTFTE